MTFTLRGFCVLCWHSVYAQKPGCCNCLARPPCPASFHRQCFPALKCSLLLSQSWTWERVCICECQLFNCLVCQQLHLCQVVLPKPALFAAKLYILGCSTQHVSVQAASTCNDLKCNATSSDLLLLCGAGVYSTLCTALGMWSTTCWTTRILKLCRLLDPTRLGATSRSALQLMASVCR